MIRLNKWLVEAGAAPARRKADELISAGRVTVNGDSAQLGQLVARADLVCLDRQVLQIVISEPVIVRYYKPVGRVSSHRPQGNDRSIFTDLSPEHADFKFIGRLDKDSEGLMILTNDGELVQEMSHPSRGHEKTYLIWLNLPLTTLDRKLLLDGVELEDGSSHFHTIETQSDGSYQIVLRQGRNRQIRRTLLALGYTVKRLQRIRIGQYSLGELQPGQSEVVG